MKVEFDEIENSKVVSINAPEEAKEYFSDIYKFCIKAVDDVKKYDKDLEQTITNMNSVNWENNTECLLYRIYKSEKFFNDNGILTIFYLDNDIIALCGAEVWNKQTISFAKRLYVLKKYRKQFISTRHLIPKQFEWAKEKHPDAKLYICTVNDYLKDDVLKSMDNVINERVTGSWNFWRFWNVYDGTLKFYDIEQYFTYQLVDKSIINNKENIRNLVIGEK